MNENDINIFLNEFKKLKEIQEEQKKRGLNDYNLLTTVLKPHDEVRLHSRVIGSLLNPDGLHYQDGLFLDIFLEVLKLKEFELDVSNTKLYLERENIDLYLTDGTKHIIIENKVYAEDQPSQIKRYIEWVFKENQNLLESDVFVIYLSLDKSKPSNLSLGKENETQNEEYFELSSGKLVYKGNNSLLKDKNILFKSIHYKNEILKWLKKSQYEIQNISNLNKSLNDYTDVVKMISNQYKEKILKLEDVLLEDDKKYQLAKEISEAFENAKKIKEKKDKELNVEKIKIILEKEAVTYKEGKDYDINIFLNYQIKIISYIDSFLLQVVDKENPYVKIDNLKKEPILKELQEIDSRFKSSYNKVYGAMEIEGLEDIESSIIEVINYCK